jgi:hypothetical protein
MLLPQRNNTGLDARAREDGCSYGREHSRAGVRATGVTGEGSGGTAAAGFHGIQAKCRRMYLGKASRFVPTRCMSSGKLTGRGR